jgi:DNA-directed RNA polymerase subunit L
MIEINTSRLHNEIIKQRLSCIPIHQTDLTLLPNNYILHVDVKNETDNILYVTTEDFRIFNKTTQHYLKREEVMQIFPPDSITQSYIDFVRLRPKISDTIPGEQLKLTCEFSVSSSKTNGMFNVVSKCSYSNTPDMTKINQLWEEIQEKYVSQDMTKEEIHFEKRNFYILDAQRHFVPNSFDFLIQTVGVYTNVEILKKSCVILQNKFVDLIQFVESDTLLINTSDIVAEYSNIENSYDIILEGEDYTIGKVLEYILYEKYYIKEKTLSFCGFKKFHPHNNDSHIRIAFVKPVDKSMVKNYIYSACVDAQEVYKKIYGMF